MIKIARKRQGITQKELASCIKVDRSYVSKLENDKIKNNPTLNQIISIAKVLKIHPYNLANWFITKSLVNNNNDK